MKEYHSRKMNICRIVLDIPFVVERTIKECFIILYFFMLLILLYMGWSNPIILLIYLFMLIKNKVKKYSLLQDWIWNVMQHGGMSFLNSVV